MNDELKPGWLKRQLEESRKEYEELSPSKKKLRDIMVKQILQDKGNKNDKQRSS